MKKEEAEKVVLQGYVTKEELAKLLAHSKDNIDKLILLLLYYSKVQISNIINLKWKDIDLVNNAIKFPKKSILITDRELHDLLLLCLKKSKPEEDYIFCSPLNPKKPITRQAAHYRIKKIAEKSGLCTITGNLISSSSFKETSFLNDLMRCVKKK